MSAAQLSAIAYAVCAFWFVVGSVFGLLAAFPRNIP
jgi:hypothetical protein